MLHLHPLAHGYISGSDPFHVGSLHPAVFPPPFCPCSTIAMKRYVRCCDGGIKNPLCPDIYTGKGSVASPPPPAPSIACSAALLQVSVAELEAEIPDQSPSCCACLALQVGSGRCSKGRDEARPSSTAYTRTLNGSMNGQRSTAIRPDLVRPASRLTDRGRTDRLRLGAKLWHETGKRDGLVGPVKN